MRGKPRILVLMTTRNGQAHLHHQLKSVLAQRGVELTLRVSDDGSTDNSYRILETFAAEHPNIELRYSGQGMGRDRSFMELLYGIEADAYDYFAFADQGDIWHANKLLVASQHISANTSRPELYYAGVRDVDERGKTLGFECASYQVCAEHPASLLLVRNWCLGCTMLVNGALVKLLQAHPVHDFGRSYEAWVHAVCLCCGGFVSSDLEHHYVARRIIGERAAGLAESLLADPKACTQMASVLLREYEDEMPSEAARLVGDVAARGESLSSRLRLWRNGGIVMPTGGSTARLRWMLLLNRF